MSIVKMKRLRVIGFEEERDELLQKLLQAQGLDRALLLVRLLLELPHGGRERHILLLQGLCGQADGLRAGRAHLGQLLVEGGELLVKFTSH